MATPDIHLLAIENWTTLAKSVDFSTITTTLNSSTSYTASDSTSGLSLNVVGTGFTPENFFGYTLLASGKITGFTFSLHGKPIAEGSDYSLLASTLSSTLEEAVLDHNALLLFDYWFSIKTIVSGTAPIVEGNLENLLPEYVNIEKIEITSGAVSVSAATFKTDENVLNEISKGFSDLRQFYKCPARTQRARSRCRAHQFHQLHEPVSRNHRHTCGGRGRAEENHRRICP